MKRTILKITALILTLALCLGLGMSAMAYDETEAAKKAEALKELSLFMGTDAGFELTRTPTRMETLIMLIRMTGKEKEALSKDWKHSFTDAPTWENADKYIGYAYANKLTSGVSDTKFDPNSPATAQTYVTFMLRALGYEDGTETVWNSWEKIGKESGLLTGSIDADTFKRGDAAELSYAALDCKIYKTENTLAEKLIKDGVFTSANLSAARILAGKKVTKDDALTDIMTAIYLGSDERVKYLAETEITKENLSFYLGVEKLDFTDGIAMEPMMSSRAHSICLVRVKDGTNVEQVKKDIKASVNPRKWICVGVEDENVRVENIGNLILLVMDNDNNDLYVKNFLALSK